MAGAFSLTAKQELARRLMITPAVHTLLYGGARSGKTLIIVRQVTARAIKAPGSRHALFRFRFSHAKSAIWNDTFPKMMRLCYPDVRYKLNKSDHFIEFPNGIKGPASKGDINEPNSEIWVGGVDDKERADKVLGQEYASILLSEASQINFQTRELIRTRLAQNIGLKLKMFYDENPPLASHWTHRLFIEKRHAEPPYDRLEDPDNYQTLWMNPADNAENLPPQFLEELQKLSPRQRLRFWEGKFGDTAEGALFSYDVIQRNRRSSVPESLLRVVVAVDPSGTKGDIDSHGDEIGIIVGALGTDGHAYIIEDLSLAAPPAVWGRVVASAYDRQGADVVVGEINYGGAMVEATVMAGAKELKIDRLRYKEVHASRGKVARAEPISALYENNLVHHVGTFDHLEDQLAAFTTRGYMGDKSPDRADALVWLLSELFPRVMRAERREKDVVVQGVAGNYDALSGRYG